MMMLMLMLLILLMGLCILRARRVRMSQSPLLQLLIQLRGRRRILLRRGVRYRHHRRRRHSCRSTRIMKVLQTCILHQVQERVILQVQERVRHRRHRHRHRHRHRQQHQARVHSRTTIHSRHPPNINSKPMPIAMMTRRPPPPLRCSAQIMTICHIPTTTTGLRHRPNWHTTIATSHHHHRLPLPIPYLPRDPISLSERRTTTTSTMITPPPPP
mmetsp:Transcript_30043/g.62808  ORF Transcript_30043/g.62808 Transcript_30043/m.62808 type:complete len:214 (+) Transcript_30043:62-703(+)